jgi:hypothetical protein
MKARWLAAAIKELHEERAESLVDAAFWAEIGSAEDDVLYRRMAAEKRRRRRGWFKAKRKWAAARRRRAGYAYAKRMGMV